MSSYNTAGYAMNMPQTIIDTFAWGYNVMMAGYVTGANAGQVINDPYKVYMSYRSDIQAIYFGNQGYTTLADFKAWLAGKTIYYELATPTTSQSTPTQISLQAGNNTAMQTDGGRLAPIDITYESDEL